MQPSDDNQQSVDSTKKSQILPAANRQISEELQLPKTPSSSAEIKTPSVAEDNDLIEKEWVDKAREIIEKTRSNPYQQQEELAQVKAAYLKKRYDKDIHASNEEG